MVDFDHGLPDNPYNKHAWIIGRPEIGEQVWIGAFCLIDAQRQPLKIGRGTNISSGAQILTHSTVKRCISEKRHPVVDSAPTEIGEFCFIGTNATILMGAKVGHHSVIGAGAVVPEHAIIPPYSIAVGVPAKVVGSSKRYIKSLGKESITISILVYNEEESIEKVIDEADKALRETKLRYEILVVNDGSKDDTLKVVKRLAKKNKKIRIVNHEVNKGFTGAIKSGFYEAKNELVLLTPGDGQFDFRQIHSFIEAIRGYDVVVGFREERLETLFRTVQSRGYHYLSRIILGINLREFSRVSLWRKHVLDDVRITVSRDRDATALSELVHRAFKKRYRFKEIPMKWGNRESGIAKASSNYKLIFMTFIGMLRVRLDSFIKR